MQSHYISDTIWKFLNVCADLNDQNNEQHRMKRLLQALPEVNLKTRLVIWYSSPDE